MNKDKSNLDNDARILAEIYRQLEANPQLNSSQLEIDVDNSTITLKGKVGTEAESSFAMKVAASVKGVSRVENQLRVGFGLAQTMAKTASQIPPATTGANEHGTSSG